MLQANFAQLTVRDNQDLRKISSWVAIAAVPTMIFGLYGMNFDHMPELGWQYGYPAVLLVVLTICVTLHRVSSAPAGYASARRQRVSLRREAVADAGSVRM